jgi:hypothetical protein
LPVDREVADDAGMPANGAGHGSALVRGFLCLELADRNSKQPVSDKSTFFIVIERAQYAQLLKTSRLLDARSGAGDNQRILRYRKFFRRRSP